MSAIIVLIILTTLCQLWFCGFSLWFFIGVICRVIFSLRCFGIIVKTRPILIGEAVAASFMLIWYFLFHKDAIPWITLLLNIVFAAMIAFFEWLDGMLYVYEIVDEDDY